METNSARLWLFVAFSGFPSSDPREKKKKKRKKNKPTQSITQMCRTPAEQFENGQLASSSERFSTSCKHLIGNEWPCKFLWLFLFSKKAMELSNRLMNRRPKTVFDYLAERPAQAPNTFPRFFRLFPFYLVFRQDLGCTDKKQHKCSSPHLLIERFANLRRSISFFCKKKGQTSRRVPRIDSSVEHGMTG